MNQALRLKETRKFLRENQEEFAENTQNSVGTISLIERGKVKTINEGIINYVRQKGISSEWLLFGEGEMLKSELSDNSEWKTKFKESEKEKEYYKEKVSKLEKTIIDIQSKMNIMYGFLLQNSDKLDLSKLDLGKLEASSDTKANLFISYSTNTRVELKKVA
ncbi:hypothetical protein [Bernardetia sp.]|uniref:hypothetical protein n=1 Tax=Bernardetia sp. TaxID=1937974 RepID=UPI0025BE8D20|nr:hypothetical protein [Bernardetia sp.]